MKFFSLKEMIASTTAKARGIDNTPSQSVVENLEALIENVLDPLREAYGKPIIVTSGYRCPELNAIVGGVKNSAHIKGFAADIVGTPRNKEEVKKLFDLVQTLGLPFRQLIYEHNSWVHIDYRRNGKGANNKQVLYA